MNYPPSSLICSPDEWPRKVAQAYEPIRFLGKGAFGCVLLAKPKRSTHQDSASMVAIKIVDGETDNDDGRDDNYDNTAYARREVTILQALNHPNIVKVVESWEPLYGEPGAMALTYSEGPTLQSLLDKGGALSTVFSRIVIAQIADAVAYLHRHAVLHRDIKPDNIIVTGATFKDDLIWHDKTNQDSVLTDIINHNHKWKATLIDFGFARALTPNDRMMTKGNVKENAKHQSLQRSSSSFLAEQNSKCKCFSRSMSAVGNYEFVAPEIMEEMQHDDHEDPTTLTDTIGHTVSEYGLLVDAYSLGCTLRYMMTGCLPHVRVKDAIARQTSLFRKVVLTMFGRIETPPKQYRLETELPLDAQRLISKLTATTASKRISVRTARQYPWIADLLPPSCPDEDDRTLEYLQFDNDGALVRHVRKEI